MEEDFLLERRAARPFHARERTGSEASAAAMSPLCPPSRPVAHSTMAAEGSAMAVDTDETDKIDESLYSRQL